MYVCIHTINFKITLVKPCYSVGYFNFSVYSSKNGGVDC